jgi:hypothetical protein
VARTPVLAERLTAQLLADASAGAVLDVVRRLLAVQAQDPRGARLAIRARSDGLTARDVDHELTVERSVVISTVNRGTLHLMRTDDYWWLHPLTTPQLLTASAKRLAQERVSPDAADRGVAVITKALTEHGPLHRADLREGVAAAGIRVEGQAFAHILLLATIRGLIVRGPIVAGEQAFVLVRDWLGKPPRPMERDVALGELARRYLAGHGPATAADLARWAGITLGDARHGLAAISSQLLDRPDGLAATADRRDRATLPPPLLLGAFDPSLLGWVSRDDIVGEHQGIVTTNGVFRPFAMVKGKAVATWTLRSGTVALTPLQKIGAADQAKLDAEAANIVDYLASTPVVAEPMSAS